MLCTLMVTATVQASETGGGVYPNGPEGFTTALPPPGTYFFSYLEHYSAGRFNDGDGDKGFFPDFDVNATAYIPRIVQIDKLKVLNASLAHAAMLPIVDLDVNIAGVHGSKAGVSDAILTPLILGWNLGNGLHAVAACDISVPIGAYRRSDLANIGRHYWAFEPVVAFAYYSKIGFTLDVKMMYDFNLTNPKAQINPLNPTGADYRTGQEFHVDFAIGQNIGKWHVGAAGYYVQQTTSDKVDDAAAQTALDDLDGFKRSLFALGPSLHYVLSTTHLIATWQHEFHSAYSTQGEKFWLKAIIPLG